MFTILILMLLLFGLVAFFAGRTKAVLVGRTSDVGLHSRPFYHGAALVIVTIGPALILALLWYSFASGVINKMVVSEFSDELQGFSIPRLQSFLSDVHALAFGGIAGFSTPLKQQAAEYMTLVTTRTNAALFVLCFVLAVAGFIPGYKKITAPMRARHRVERVVTIMLLLSSAIAIFATIGIVMSLLFETVRFFDKVSFFDFLFGMHWSPQGAFEGAGAVGDTTDYSVIFGAVPLFAGTLLITLIAMAVATPIGLFAAIYLSDYSSRSFRSIAKPVLEVLAGIPTVVYGFFAALTVAPVIRGWGEYFGLSVASESALAAGLVMGIMIIPFISSLSDDVINSVPQTLRDGSYALGATKSETILNVVLPAALPGVVSALLLAVSRAIGETMIVVMAAGLAANLTINPLEAVTTVTVQIVTLLVGDQEFDSAKTLAAFALGLVLFCITLALNVIALRVVNRYREQYD